jgi:hypothetical protein
MPGIAIMTRSWLKIPSELCDIVTHFVCSYIINITFNIITFALKVLFFKEMMKKI